MSRSEFFNLLQQEGIDPNLVAFNDSISAGYNIRKSSEGWKAFYRDKGREYHSVDFDSESEALQFMYRMLVYNSRQLQRAGHSVKRAF